MFSGPSVTFVRILPVSYIEGRLTFNNAISSRFDGMSFRNDKRVRFFFRPVFLSFICSFFFLLLINNSLMRWWSMNRRWMHISHGCRLETGFCFCFCFFFFRANQIFSAFISNSVSIFYTYSYIRVFPSGYIGFNPSSSSSSNSSIFPEIISFDPLASSYSQFLLSPSHLL